MHQNVKKKSNIKIYFNRESGQGTSEELRSRDFRKELDDREKDIKTTTTKRTSEPQAKRTKVDQVPAASLDADDPLEGDSTDSDDSDDDTAALLAELNRIKKERAIEQAKKVRYILDTRVRYYTIRLFLY